MKLVLLGAPGAGKGTIAKLLAAVDGSVQISTGDMLRSAVDAGTELGKQAQDYIRRGELVADDLIIALMEHRLQQADCANGFLLDGFPRTIRQAEELTRLFGKLSIALDLVVNLEVPKEELLTRLTTRRTCVNRDCQAIYNLRSKPPAVEGICDNCGSAVLQRDDETEPAIMHRLETYHEKTAPLIGFYAQQGLLMSVQATATETILKTILAHLEAD